uniref:uncharacterized protein LOC128929694 n=1 Tax=Callithrix jacchus TaxID=9483 RepID=UPI0023DD1CA2|nr:uncharacterized protein LOC128929694 [Callithrix jacchus]
MDTDSCSLSPKSLQTPAQLRLPLLWALTGLSEEDPRQEPQPARTLPFPPKSASRVPRALRAHAGARAGPGQLAPHSPQHLGAGLERASGAAPAQSEGPGVVAKAPYLQPILVLNPVLCLVRLSPPSWRSWWLEKPGAPEFGLLAPQPRGGGNAWGGGTHGRGGGGGRCAGRPGVRAQRSRACSVRSQGGDAGRSTCLALRSGSLHSHSKPESNLRDWQQCPSPSPALFKVTLTGRGEPTQSNSSGIHFEQPREKLRFLREKASRVLLNPGLPAHLSVVQRYINNF